MAETRSPANIIKPSITAEIIIAIDTGKPPLLSMIIPPYIESFMQPEQEL